MSQLTLLPVLLPFLLGFSIYLIPPSARWLALSTTLVSAAYALRLFSLPTAIELHWLDHFGVTLIADNLSSFFILANALVTAAVILNCWPTARSAFFYIQAIVLHGSLNAVFISADLISLYVALEIISISAFLLIAYPRSDRAIWIGLRYLFISNTAMLFYLVGAVLTYQANHSFAFSGLQSAPPEAIALVLLGLLTKGGIFVSGLWLPLTHAEATAPVSALLSGIAVKAGVFPLLRCALLVPALQTPILILGLATALLGVVYAMVETDVKRLLAFSTISQLGFVLASPAAGGFYALSHGLAKALLFLNAGALPSRNLQQLREQPLPATLWWPLALGSLSISGLPLLAGFGAKVLSLKELLPWQDFGMNLAAGGTVIVFARLLWLPRGAGTPSPGPTGGLTMATLLLVGGLVAANGFYLEAYGLANLLKPLATLALGWTVYGLLARHLSLALPRAGEQFEHLIGAMSLSLVVLFGMVLR